MALKEGDRVRIVTREATAEDRKTNRYFPHMAGLEGTVESVYSADEVSVKIDPAVLQDPAKAVHTEATRRMRERFISSVSEEAKAQLTPEELNFGANYVLLARTSDLEKV